MSTEDADFTHVAVARDVLAHATYGALGTLMPATHKGSESPYVSLVQVVLLSDGRLAFMLSDLAQHTRNIKQNTRASLLIDTTTNLPEDRLAGTRLTVQGEVVLDQDSAVVAQFCAAHPDAKQWVDFTDFKTYALTIERAHLVAGFGKIGWVDGPDLWG